MKAFLSSIAFLSSTAFRSFPIPQGGLEIPIVSKNSKSEALDRIFDIMKEKVN